jgi:aspartyl-tRNA(Asn)/glutamyl-tRNA(Gln) amidotransferase subunit A
MASVSLPQSISTIVERVHTGAASAVELTEAALHLVEELEPKLNAFITVMRDSALLDARRVDRAVTGKNDPGRLAGVVFAVKDALLTTGAPTTGGSSVFSEGPAEVDALAITRLREAGAILLGKTNMHEFGWGLDERVGLVGNPAAPGRSAGGSSSGSAAAVAARSVTFALGTDAGGSVRMPAAFCGVTGLKPTHGVVPHDGSIPGCLTLTEVGPIATTAADARIVFQVLTANRLSKPRLRKPPVVGVVAGSVAACTPEVAEPLGRAIATLAGRGWTTEVELKVDDVADKWLAIFAAETAAALSPAVGLLLEEMSADLRRLVALGARISAVEYLRAHVFRDELAHRLDSALEGHDALLTPTVPSAAPDREPEWEDEDFFGDMRWTVPANMTGHPAVTVQVPWAAPPAGLQLIGRRGEDDRLLALAGEVQAELERNNR